MKIVIVGHSGMQYPHTRVRCYGFAKALKERGFETEVFSFKDHLAEHLREEDMYAHLRDRDKMKLVLNATWKLLFKRVDLLYIQKVHFHSAAPYMLHRFLRKRYILDYDDYDVPLSNFFHRGCWNRLLFGSHKWDVITEKMARRAAGCVVSSHALEDYMRPLNSRVTRIETGVDTGDFHPPREEHSPEAPLTYLWNGIVWGDEIFNCVVLAIQAFERVNREFPNSRMMIVGGGFHWHRLVEFTKTHYDHVPIIFHGWFPPQAMPSILREADVGILPFAEDNEWVRSKSPTKLFEYLATGLAVVASNVGEVSHVIRDGENGLLVDSLDGMAGAMLTLARENELRKSISRNARLTAIDHYSMEVLGDRLAEFLKQFER